METIQQYATDIEGKIVSAPVAAAINTATENKTLSLVELLSVLVLVANVILTTTKKTT